MKCPCCDKELIITISASGKKNKRFVKPTVKEAKVFDCPVTIVMPDSYKDVRKWINSGTFSHEKLMDSEVKK